MNWPRVIILADADAFFAAVEIRDNPQYKGKPVIVGAQPGRRGVVSTCSYEARKYGVRSAMPISRAYRLCPQGIYLPPRGQVYSQVSARMFAVYERYSPIVERVSIDEGYMDVTPEDGVEIARAIKAEIRDTLGITVTAGVSYCRFLAKIAAEEAKPDGLGVVAPEEAMDFLETLSVRKIPGVGPKTMQTLEAHGIKTVGNLRSMPPAWFHTTLGKFGARLRELSMGIDSTPVVAQQKAKSISEETTFEKDQRDSQTLRVMLAKLSQDVGYRLRQGGSSAKTVGIKVRYSDFTTVTRARTLPSPVSSDPEIYKTAKALFEKLSSTRPVRLLGVAVTNLSDRTPLQPGLFQADRKDWDSVSEAVDALREKLGKDAVTLAAAVRKPK